MMKGDLHSRCLNGHLELLFGDDFLQLADESDAAIAMSNPNGQGRERRKLQCRR